MKRRECSCEISRDRLSGSDIKDKSELLNGRKAIEREMERFKLCEKEMKTKAFSKEGLGQSAKQDPRERARSEIRDWMNTTVDTLNLQASIHLRAWAIPSWGLGPR